MWKMLKLPNKPSLNNQWFGILLYRTGTDWYWPQSLPYGLTSTKICRHILFNHICVLISFNGHPVFPGSHNCFMITSSPYICSRQCLTCNTLLRSSHIKCLVGFFLQKTCFYFWYLKLDISIKCSLWIHNQTLL